MAIFCGGHVLFDDLPGTGKTTLVKVLARVLGSKFSRVQFTPDLMPSDILGMSVFNQKAGDFEIRLGPLMTNLFLADEINRAIPRTQAALLEAMEEQQATIDSQTFSLPSPFLVMATQNPVEMESTFNLPIAQMDRFLIRISLGYPNHSEELKMLRVTGDEIPLDSVKQVLDDSKVTAIQKRIREVTINESVLDYIVSIVEATRTDKRFRLPAGPRGSRALYRAGKTWAAMHGRDFVTPDDIKEIALPVLCHRMTLSQEALLEGWDDKGLMTEILSLVKAPMSKEEILNKVNDPPNKKS
jgi:MoxR-like ATPase